MEQLKLFNYSGRDKMYNYNYDLENKISTLLYTRCTIVRNLKTVVHLLKTQNLI